MPQQKTILVAPLHWGLGHATRCIPIIRAILKSGCHVIIASDGAALYLLQKEFPQLPSLELPSYGIEYPKKGKNIILKLLLKLPKIKRAISSEKKIIKKLVSEKIIHGIISDNRIGVRSNQIPSVFITHQLNVLSGSTTFFSSKFHRNIINKFDECWVPDLEGSMNLSGTLGHLGRSNHHIKYIGLLSRMQKKILPIEFDVLIILSGPEPHRTYLEEKLIAQFKDKEKRILLIRGLVEHKQVKSRVANIQILNYALSDEMEQFLNKSDVVISRSGYTSIMDLAVLAKKAFFIPTPGQFEQEYLAKRLHRLGIAPSCEQSTFESNKLNGINRFKGFSGFKGTTNLYDLFALFEGK